MIVQAPISVGELLDKITILELKTERMHPDLAANAKRELDSLIRVAEQHIKFDDGLLEVLRDLKAINSILWEVEDRKRSLIYRNELGAEFVELARSVCINNDARAALKRQINISMASEIFEVKSYSLT